MEKELAERNKQITIFSEQTTVLEQVLSDRDKQITALRGELSDRDNQIVELTGEVAGRGEWALRLDAELKRVRADYQNIIRSSSWRVTLPLREVRRWLASPEQQARRYFEAGLGISKRVYKSLPLSHRTKAMHRRWLARYFPSVLLPGWRHISTAPVFQVLADKGSQVAPGEPPEYLPGTPLPGLAAYTSNKPVVSVIIPVYGKLEYTLQCLESIKENPPQTAFEVIVIDDKSPDGSAEVIADITGVRLIRNRENLGFIRSCNKGAQEARGQYLHFLNNDTQVTPGWLDELFRTFDDFPGTGLAGSRLIYPDGRLQEAGGIIWQNGSAWNFGRFQDPSLPVYNYAREVDYCSGASIMVPKALFDDLGGFDEHYLPAYCEDSDLALKLRERGCRVIYQPFSTVIHHEGVSSGTDISQGTKAYQVENSKKLFERWEERLRAHQPPGVDIDKAMDRRAKRRVLVIDHCTPTPDQDAGSGTVYNLLLLLREMDFQVTFIPEDNFFYLPEYTTLLQRTGIEMLYAPYVTAVEQHLKECGERYDLVFLFRPGVVERHLKCIRRHSSKAKILYHTVDLHYLRMEREAGLQNNKRKKKAAADMKQRELASIRSVDATIVHSTTEQEILQPLVPDASLHVYPLIMNTRGTNAGFAERKDIVFVGGYQHSPNVDAVQYFVNEVMPLLKSSLPGIRFYAVGSKPPKEIQALARDDVIVTGFVEDLSSLLDKIRVSVAPLRYGAGIKGKIGTAMAVGLPVVVTSLAAEGMSLTDGENVLIADGAKKISDAIVKVYRDESEWQRLSRNGLAFADRNWGAAAAWKTLADILLDMGMPVDQARYPLSLYDSSPVSTNGSSSRAQLAPVGVAENQVQFERLINGTSVRGVVDAEKSLLESGSGEEFFLNGYCAVCDETVPLLVDMQSGGRRLTDGILQPNWRERLVCPTCQMNNRQRLVATLVKQLLDKRKGMTVYFMEQVTPIFQWASDEFKQHEIYGSEYLGHEYEGGSTVKGIRHEDVEDLSFSDGSLDLVVSNDVFEHVPHPSRAFTECARVLRPGGVLLATIPFHASEDVSVIRAQLVNGELEQLLPAVYHGNPVSDDGSLVFTDFGWDILDVMRAAGFSRAGIEVYASAEYGHLGGGQIVFRAER
ncbi:MAG TPA: glycosyltransferase [Gammaproteobacteria bacterium]|nr:glycosyltransferase [Gammaproteobacteria bacterium]